MALRDQTELWGFAMDQVTSATHAIAATTITVAGVTTGLSYEILLAGFAGALASLSYLDAMPAWRRLWSLVTSTLTAGYTAPVMAAGLEWLLPTLELSNGTMVAAGFILGVTAQALIPGALVIVRRKSETV